MPDSSREEIAKLEALYANNPAGRVFTHLAEAYRKAGEYERARGILNEGLQKHPGYASAYVVMGRVLLDLQNHDEAANAFRQVLDLDPHNLVALQSLGELARTAGHTDEAIRHYEELRQHDPGNDEIEQILNDLRNPPAQPPTFEPEYPAADEAVASSSRTEEWRPESTEYEPEQSAWVEPHADAAAGTDSRTGYSGEPDIVREPEPEPWSSAQAEAETDTPEPAAPFSAEASHEDFHLGWVEQERNRPPESNELGDLSSISQAAGEFEIVGETFAPEDINLGISQGETAAPEETGDGEGEVLTETIADLYRRQGLYDRAADVYRALLRSRPGDPDLEAKLAEVEALAQPVTQMEVPPDPWAERDPWETATPEEVEAEDQGVDTEQAAAWLAGGAAPAESLPTPYAWTEQAAEIVSDSGRAISVYFRELLAWQPRRGEAQVTEPATASEAFEEWFGAAEPAASGEASAPSPPVSQGEQPGSEGQEDDDDDLEMFRSWLQSLKK